MMPGDKERERSTEGFEYFICRSKRNLYSLGDSLSVNILASFMNRESHFWWFSAQQHRYEKRRHLHICRAGEMSF